MTFESGKNPFDQFRIMAQYSIRSNSAMKNAICTTRVTLCAGLDITRDNLECTAAMEWFSTPEFPQNPYQKG